MVIFDHRLETTSETATWQLPLTAEERSRTRYRFDKPGFPSLFIQLPRGTFLCPGDYLGSPTGETLAILAAEESLFHVTSGDRLTLLQAAYHLGNRHVPLEINLDYLRLAPDPVLGEMLRGLGLTVTEITAPFFPERGAFHSH
ncbi:MULTISPECIES: urease accessory protein UreE [unclassified Synechocystis]|uniref:urease accessory protein UreE n=1 Tax=unclassified Synechocystis TaxID=2640012 RepID=UPI00040B6EB7|nr:MULTISPECIES: urease accessory protein UreE [unclassified Synechocystis]AIE75831.1 Urease accessory protein UreE [Synechocystis sp. PCC 6714]MCT0255236.1 urease accessory protein UreE [Synechocystis sp. CS-94]